VYNCASTVCTRLRGISRFRFSGIWLSVIGLLVSDVWKDHSGKISEFQGILEEWHHITDNCSSSTHHYEAFKFHVVLKTYFNNPYTCVCVEPSDKAVGCNESPDWLTFFEPLIVKNVCMTHLWDRIFQNINWGQLLSTLNNKMSVCIFRCDSDTVSLGEYWMAFRRIVVSSSQGSDLSSWTVCSLKVEAHCWEHVYNNAVSHPRRSESSAVLSWEPQISRVTIL